MIVWLEFFSMELNSNRQFRNSVFNVSRATGKATIKLPEGPQKLAEQFNTDVPPIRGLDIDMLRKDKARIEKSRKQTKTNPVMDVEEEPNELFQTLATYLTCNIHKLGATYKNALDRVYESVCGGSKFKGNGLKFKNAIYMFQGKSAVPNLIIKSGGDNSPGNTGQICYRAPEIAFRLVSKINYLEIENPDESLIFRDVGHLDIPSEIRRLNAETSLVRNNAAAREAEEQIKIRMGLDRIEKAGEKRFHEDLIEETLGIEKKRELIRAPELPLDPNLNPFSLKNASLMPLIDQPTAEHTTRRQLGDDGSFADQEYGLENLGLGEWEDEDGKFSCEDKARLKLSKLVSQPPKYLLHIDFSSLKNSRRTKMI